MLTLGGKFFFFFNDTATTEIYTLSLHDALPISVSARWGAPLLAHVRCERPFRQPTTRCKRRSEEHTSELQSPCNLVCRLLLEKKKQRQQARPMMRDDARASDLIACRSSACALST